MSDQLFVRYCSHPDGHAPKDCPDRNIRSADAREASTHTSSCRCRVCIRAEAKRCDSCDRLAEAFEAMREALDDVTEMLEHMTTADYAKGADKATRLRIRAALALADAVSKVSR